MMSKKSNTSTAELKPVKAPGNNVPEAAPDAMSILRAAPKAGIPSKVSPMLATLTDKPFDAEGWQYEVKWDGYRAMAIMQKSNVELLSRNNKSFNEKFYVVHDALVKMKLNAVLDGEIIVVHEDGKADFGDLQNWRSEADGQLLFYVFDILWFNGKDLTGLPLTDRRAVLKDVLPASPYIILSENFKTTATEFFAASEKMGLEGIMAKRDDSIYIMGGRTTDWLKIKTQLRHEVVIGGFTRNEGTAKQFSALLVGVYRDGILQYTGKIGTGFNDKTQREMMKLFNPLIIKKTPFNQVPDINKPSRFRPMPPKAVATWLKPELVCEVSYREMTSDGVMRHPSFEGMRTDKPAKSVGDEQEVKSAAIVKRSSPPDGNNITLPQVAAADVKTFLNPADETQQRKVNGHDIKFSNLHKVFWPKENFTKRDMLNYYFRIAPYILPYLKDRPQSLNRFPNGIDGKSFYQKDVTGKVPEWVKTFPYESEGEHKNFMLCNDEAALLLMVNMGAIEMNPWSSTIKKPDNPDYCIIDLDPDKNHFDQVIETANVTRQLLTGAGINCYCKTSGSTGLHIYIPLGKKYDYEQSKEFGRLIATLVHEQLPGYTSIERLTANRRGKLYIDFLQNRPQATIAAAYSVRPKPGATVSMPLHWDEVKKGMRMSDFNIKNAPDRIKEMGDIFKPVLGKGISITAALKHLQVL